MLMSQVNDTSVNKHKEKFIEFLKEILERKLNQKMITLLLSLHHPQMVEPTIGS